MFPITKIMGGGLILAGVLLAAQTFRVELLRSNVKAARAEVVACDTGHAITKQSLKTLEQSLALMVKDGEARREAANAALQSASKANRASLATAARLRALTASGRCDSSHLKGLGL